MHGLWMETLLKAAIPAAIIVLALTLSRLRGFDWRSDLRLLWPSTRVIAMWLAIWLVWMVATEIVIYFLGLPEPAPWHPYPLTIILLRILAIGLLGPIAEELVFRGMLFYRLEKHMGAAATIVTISVLWSLLHFQYDWQTILLICGDGLILGLARFRSRSTFVPMLMHAIGNMYSIYQSLSG
ncbi:MAG: CPBP family intramembrane glutamic endopeptidase [Acidobacteriota bacterium]